MPSDLDLDLHEEEIQSMALCVAGACAVFARKTRMATEPRPPNLKARVKGSGGASKAHRFMSACSLDSMGLQLLERQVQVPLQLYLCHSTESL